MSKYSLLVLLISISCMTSACTRTAENKDIGNNGYNCQASNRNTTQNTYKEQESIITSTNAQVEEVTSKERINNSISKSNTDEDFEIVYESLHINKDTKIEDVVNVLGLPDDYYENNEGYISGNTKYRSWNLSYPNYSNSQIRIIVLSERKYDGEEVTDGDGYVVGIYLESFETQKGLKVGDQLDKVLELYGKPESYQNSILRYSKGNSNLEIKLNDDNETVDSIFIDYNMKKSKEEQDSANN